MFTTNDIEQRQLFIVNGFEHRKLKVDNFRLALYDTEKGVCETRIPFGKILALFVVGPCTLTTPLIQKCNRHGVPIVTTSRGLRPIFFYSKTAEANFLLRQKQYAYSKEETKIAKVLVANKLLNQKKNLQKLRKKTEKLEHTVLLCEESFCKVEQQKTLNDLRLLEALVAKSYFSTYFEPFQWIGRMQRTKVDMLNVLLDIGYTILFNFIECMLCLFGFDLYIGVYHQAWFARKSLVCDMVEPFRPLIDREIRKNINYKKFKEEDFLVKQDRYFLKRKETKKYYEPFFKVLVAQKTEVFIYISQYYRCFMGKKSVPEYPHFLLK